MNIHNIDTENYLAYDFYKSQSENSPTVIFHHGLMTDRKGRKSVFLKELCAKLDLNYLCFDNFGHGDSSGVLYQQTIGHWLTGYNNIIAKLVQSKVILVGSSLGGWLSLLAAKSLTMQNKDQSKLIGMILLAPAPDFSEELMWQKMTTQQQELLLKNGVITLPDITNPDLPGHILTYNFINEARNHLIFNNKNLEFNFDVTIIHGKLDYQVDYRTSIRLLDILQAPKITLNILQNSHHNLSSTNDLKELESSLKNILN